MKRVKGNEIKIFIFVTIAILFMAAFVSDSPGNIMWGMKQIIISRSALITDYFELAGMGAAFLNAALVMSICTLLIIVGKIPFTGPTIAALFMNAGYALWGKNIINILPILLGTYLYAKLHHARFGRYIYTALFSTCLAPFTTELIYILPFSSMVNIIISILTAIIIGFLMPPIAAHTASMHMGYNLFNVGFAGGVLAFIIVCFLRSFGLESEPILLWQEEQKPILIIGLYVYFVMTILYGLWINKGSFRGLGHLFGRPGRAVTDFVLMDGPGLTLINMGLMGITGTTYVLVINGDFSGPVVGALGMIFGFAAFGAHIRNYLPVLSGIYLFSFVSKYQMTDPGILLAALFGVGIAPIAGQFGILAGMFAGVLHSVIVMCTSGMYGGLNLYNNGFSAGFVAIFIAPTLESFIKHFKDKRYRKKKQEQQTNVQK